MLMSTRNNKNETLESSVVTPNSSSFSEFILRIVSNVGRTSSSAIKSRSSSITDSSINTNSSATTIENSNNNTFVKHKQDNYHHSPSNSINNHNHNNRMNTNPAAPFWPTNSHWPSKRSCNAPPSRRFGHPCSCSHQRVSVNNQPAATSSSSSLSSSSMSFSSNITMQTSNNNNSLPPPSASPVYLYDSASKKCLPTTRSRDMLLKDCHSHAVNTHPSKPQQQNLSCYYDDLTCDPRRYRCICKPPLHLYYDSNQTFGCVPMEQIGSPDGRINCRPGQVYNVISKECQKIFDVSELPPTNIASVSAIQFLFVTFTLIWFLLLILLVTTKLKKLRTLNIYRGSPATERRRLDHRSRGLPRHPGQGTSAWLHPFIAAVNGHHHFNQHRTTVDRHTQSILVDETGPYSDTDFFLAGGNRRSNDLYSDRNHSSSQLSLNNPPPKFEEIYPSCPVINDTSTNGIHLPVSTEDLPSYDEAMKLQGGGGATCVGVGGATATNTITTTAPIDGTGIGTGNRSSPTEKE